MSILEDPTYLRDSEMVRRYCAGESLQKIGDSYGITRERVRQIVKACGITSLDGGVHVAALKRAEIRQRALEARREARKQKHLELVSRVVHERLSGKSWTDIAVAVGYQEDSSKGTSLPGWIKKLLVRYDMQNVIPQIFVRDGAFSIAQSRAQLRRRARERAAA